MLSAVTAPHLPRVPFSPVTEDLEGVAVAQSVECATSGEEVWDSIPAVAAHSPLVGSVSVCQYNVTG